MKYPAFQFYVGDWLKDPQLRMCSPATRGIWMDWLCAMHELDRCGQLTGSLAQLARLGYCSEAEVVTALAELESTGAADVERDSHGIVTLTNRRMSREHRERVNACNRKRKERNKSSVTELSRANGQPGHGSVTDLSREMSRSGEAQKTTDVTTCHSKVTPNLTQPETMTCQSNAEGVTEKSRSLSSSSSSDLCTLSLADAEIPTLKEVETYGGMHAVLPETCRKFFDHHQGHQLWLNQHGRLIDWKHKLVVWRDEDRAKGQSQPPHTKAHPAWRAARAPVAADQEHRGVNRRGQDAPGQNHRA